MKLKGLDNGYFLTKDNERRSFKSAFSLIDNEVLCESRKIIIDNKTYYFGVGNPSTNINKIQDDVTMVSTLANLALSGGGEFSIVAGLPIEQYKSKKDDFINMMMFYNNMYVVYDNKKLQFKIQNISIYPQGAGALYSMNDVSDGDYIIVDIGSYTINIVYFEVINLIPKIKKYQTVYENGLMHFYTNYIKAVNKQYGTNFNMDKSQKIMRNGIKIEGVKQDMSYVKEVINSYMSNIITPLKLNFPYRTADILICGGGAEILKDEFKKEFRNAKIINDPQFANAKGFYNIACRAYGG